jgi:peptidoglycan/LPS O-acetylase OafA/YrhL
MTHSSQQQSHFKLDPSRSKGRLLKLDGLRGLFCLMIVFWHYDNQYLPVNLNGWFLYDQLYLGVDFFFVLSGFVISLRYYEMEGWSQGIQFLKKRFARLYPLLLFSTMVYAAFRIVTYLLLPQLSGKETSWSKMALDTLETLFLTNATPLLGNSFGMNIPSWSISGEMVAYFCCFAIAMAVPTRRRFVAWILLFTWVVAFMWFAGHPFDATTDWGFCRALIGFSMGCIVAKVPRVELPAWSDAVMLVLVVALFYLLHGCHGAARQLLGLLGCPVVFGLTIYALNYSKGYIGNVLESQPLQFLGEKSYSIYLNHLVIVAAFPKVCFMTVGDSTSFFWRSLVFVISIGVVLIYSTWTYRVVEVGWGGVVRRRMMRRCQEQAALA